MRPCLVTNRAIVLPIFVKMVLAGARSDLWPASTLPSPTRLLCRQPAFVLGLNRRSFCASSRTNIQQPPVTQQGRTTSRRGITRRRQRQAAHPADGAKAFCNSETVAGAGQKQPGGSFTLGPNARRAGRISRHPSGKARIISQGGPVRVCILLRHTLKQNRKTRQAF